ncbi:MAG: V4R domain-containing protein [Thermoleophilia bacterium]|nr:V4R domain-containing protein [Thermoleophilia bacterium]
MFREERDQSQFEWKDLGDITVGRPNLGPTTSVAVYRLMQYTMRDVLIKDYGVERADALLFEAGKVAGKALCRNLLDTKLEPEAFISDLSEKLIGLSVGVLRVETADLDKMEFILTVAEDLDCSGLPVSDETVCNYDEGFIAGILEEFSGIEFNVREVDCWASGERICRFEARAA